MPYGRLGHGHSSSALRCVRRASEQWCAPVTGASTGRRRAPMIDCRRGQTGRGRARNSRGRTATERLPAPGARSEPIAFVLADRSLRLYRAAGLSRETRAPGSCRNGTLLASVPQSAEPRRSTGSITHEERPRDRSPQ